MKALKLHNIPSGYISRTLNTHAKKVVAVLFLLSISILAFISADFQVFLMVSGTI